MDVFPLLPNSENGKLATVRSGNTTLQRRNQTRVDNIQRQEDTRRLSGNRHLYEATPDHSILKNGFAKSLTALDEDTTHPIYMNFNEGNESTKEATNSRLYEKSSNRKKIYKHGENGFTTNHLF